MDASVVSPPLILRVWKNAGDDVLDAANNDVDVEGVNCRVVKNNSVALEIFIFDWLFISYL
jgi:hypothetical protein